MSSVVKIILWVVLAAIFLVAGIYIWESLKKDMFGDFTKQEKVVVHDIVLEKIEAMGKLELVKYQFKDVLEYKIEKRFMPDAKAVLIISGEAVGCIDLKKIKPADIVEQDSTIFVRLPKPELCYVKVKHDESRVYSTSNTYFDEGKMIENAYKSAEKQIEKAALQSNMIEQTKQNAELILKPLLEVISRKEVVFKYDLPEQEIKKEPVSEQK